MEKIKYPFDWRVILLGVGGYTVMILLAVFGNPSHPQLWQFVAISGSIWVWIVADLTYGTYGSLDKSQAILSRTNSFFFTKRIKVEHIQTIYYRPTWIISGMTRSLYIIGYVNEKEKIIEFPNVGWHESVLAKMAKDLKQLNSSIQFDEHAEALIKKYS